MMMMIINNNAANTVLLLIIILITTAKLTNTRLLKQINKIEKSVNKTSILFFIR